MHVLTLPPGCLTCRRRHKKCDEERPICRGCQKGGRKCQYGSSSLKWKAVCHPSVVANLRKNSTGDPISHNLLTAREDNLTEPLDDWAVPFIGPEMTAISEQYHTALPVSGYFPLLTQRSNMFLSHADYPTTQISSSIDHGTIMVADEPFGPNVMPTLILSRHADPTQVVERFQGECVNENYEPTENNTGQASIANLTLEDWLINSCHDSYLSMALTNTYEKIAYSFCEKRPLRHSTENFG